MPKTSASLSSSPVTQGVQTLESVYLFSPSGAVMEVASVERAVERLRGLGLRVTVDRTALKRWQRFAGNDRERLAALGRAAASDCDLLLATRGGYGLTRLLPDIDFSALAAAGKTWCGHSDLTALFIPLAWQHRRAPKRTRRGRVYFGPMACFDFGSATIHAQTLAQFEAVLHGTPALDIQFVGDWHGPKLKRKHSNPSLEGMLWGGNLSMVCALLGTPYMKAPPTGRDVVWFFEDTGEHPYQVERMLTQLHQAGFFKQSQAILLGEFTQYQLVAHDHGFTLDTVAQWLNQVSGIPVITGAPFGHGPAKLMLPLGASARIQAHASPPMKPSDMPRTLQLQWSCEH